MISWTRIKSIYYRTCLVLTVRKPIAGIFALKSYVKAKLFKKPVLRGVDIVTNYSCNMACTHCNISTMKKKGVDTLSLDEYRDFEKQCTEMGVFQYTFTGGEPLLRKDFETLVKIFKPYKRVILVQTNGKLITSVEKAVWLKKIGVDVVNMSLDSGFADEHDDNRGLKGSYVQTMDAIDRCGKAGLSVALGTVITHKNLHSEGINKLFEYVKENNIILILNLAVPAGEWYNNKDVLLTKEDQLFIREEVKRNPFIGLDLDSTINTYGCPAFKEKLYITPYGDVTGCTFVQISFGNIRKTPLKEIRALALDVNLMNEFSTSCYAAEKEDFIQKYMSQLGGDVPKYYSDVMRGDE